MVWPGPSMLIAGTWVIKPAGVTSGSSSQENEKGKVLLDVIWCSLNGEGNCLV